MRVAPIVKAVQHLEAGEWKAAHLLVQKDASSLGCWAHGIVHLIEGDLDNAKYWYHARIDLFRTAIRRAPRSRRSRHRSPTTPNKPQPAPAAGADGAPQRPV